MTEAMPQQFVTDEAEVTPDQHVPEQPANGQPVAEQTDAQATGGRRGRPRSQEAMDRDQRVLDTLDNGQVKTRNEIAEELGFTGGLTYLSLYRLVREGKVVRVADGTTRRAWRQTTPEDVVAPTAESEQPAEA